MTVHQHTFCAIGCTNRVLTTDATTLGAGAVVAEAISGVGIGGLSGGWLTHTEAERSVWSRAGLDAYGFTPGPGTVHVLGVDECPVQHVGAMLAQAAGESAGQCGPCMFGVPAVAEDLGLLAAGRLDQAGFQRLRGRLGLLPGRGACRFPDGVAGYAHSAFRAFGPEVSTHLAGRCSMNATARRTDVVAV